MEKKNNNVNLISKKNYILLVGGIILKSFIEIFERSVGEIDRHIYVIIIIVSVLCIINGFEGIYNDLNKRR